MRVSFKLFQLLLCLFLSTGHVFAQLSVSTPNSTTRVKACDDYFTQRLGNPVDMNDTGDINNYLTGIDVTGFSSKSISGGNFNFTTQGTLQGIFYLFSPDICFFHSARGGSRWGEQLPLVNADVAAKYTNLTVRMYIDPTTPETLGWTTLINRSCDATQNYTITNYMDVVTGWQNYTVDLSDSSNIDTGASLDDSAWTTGNITGLAIKPAQLDGRIGKVDYIRLEDPDSCATTSSSFTATATGSASLYNLYLDKDTDISNGYYKKIATAATAAGAGSVSPSMVGLEPGSYYVTGFLNSDAWTLESDDPLDFGSSTDISTTSGISGGAFASGLYSGSTSSSDQQIYFRMPEGGINTSKYRYLSFKISRSNDSGNNPLVISTNANGYAVYPSVHHIGGGIYQVDLQGRALWTGTVTSVSLRPATASGVTFDLDWFYITKDGYRNTEDSAIASQIVSSSGQFEINNSPILTILEPDSRGGEAFKAWNMRPDDLKIYSNHRDDADPENSGETYTAYLPDSRTVDGLRGDFFKGTNEIGDGDPNAYFTFPTLPGNESFSSSTYKNICMKMNIDYVQDYCLGTLGRYTVVDSEGEFHQTIGISWIYDNWTSSKWSPELCIDSTTIGLESADPWPETITGFRVDQHEFEKDTCENGVPVGNEISVATYIDYVKVTRIDVTRDSSYVITFNLNDDDSADTPTVSFYYSSSNNISGGTLIGTADSTDTFLNWDTTGVPSGTYYVYGVATDTYDTAYAVSTGPVEVGSLTSSINAIPILELESPTANQAVCDDLQLKGYAIDASRNEMVTVHVTIDGDALTAFHPTLYSPSAVVAYPSLDSSNSGFNQLIDVTDVTAGAHTVVVTARTSDGQTASESFSITKQGSGCSDPLTDPAPTGTPIAVDVDGTGASEDPVIKSAKLTVATKKLLVKINKAKVAGISCTMSLYGGKNASNVNQLLLSGVAVTKANGFKMTKLKAKKKNAKFVKVVKDCGLGDQESDIKAAKIK